MTWRTLLGCLVLAAGLGCTHSPAPLLFPVHTIAVLPPNNLTGDPLLIGGASFYEKYVARSDRFTVADALAAAARGQLARRGLTVVPPVVVDATTGGRTPVSAQDAGTMASRGGIDTAVLYIEVRRWEADVPFHPGFIIASVGICLLDPSGRVLWTREHPSRPVATPGVVNFGEASEIAAGKLMHEMLAGMGSHPAS